MADAILHDDVTEQIVDAVEQKATEAKDEVEESKVEKPKAEQTFTQAELDKIIQDRLARQASKYSDYETVKADADKWRQAEREKLPREQQTQAELDDLRKAREAEAAEFAAFKLEVLRERVAREKGLSDKLAARLSGTTREELEADADDLLEAFPARKSVSQQPLDGLSGGGKRDTAPVFDPKKLVEEIPGF
ncbi:DUF4355 domain-containing protein [Tsukamurella tyrosinosolvens]|uniref:capsid assembly scaffolding protein Gp46 family protein n=1 Tax=Tsukamurella tyrosinosolvens TaxID=57704 RepID=UPI00346204CD